MADGSADADVRACSSFDKIWASILCGVALDEARCCGDVMEARSFSRSVRCEDSVVVAAERGLVGMLGDAWVTFGWDPDRDE